MNPAPKFLLALLLAGLPWALAGCNRENPDTATAAKPAPPSVVAPASSAVTSTSTNAASAASSTNAAPAAASAGQPLIIVKDAFSEDTNPDQNSGIVGIKPAPIDLPDAAWQLAVGDGAYETYITPPATNAAVCFHSTAAIGLSLASHGAYVKPAVMTISADLGNGGDTPTAFCGLGFYSVLARPHTGGARLNFTGLILYLDGSLQLIENGAPGATIKFTGKYDPVQPTTLSYSIDTATGAISNVSLAGSTSTYAFKSSAFTDAATAFAGIGGDTDGGSFCFVTKLQISAGIVLPPPPPPAPPVSVQDSTQTNAP